MTRDVKQTVEAYFSHYPLRSYPKGQILLHAEEAPQYIYYLVSGNVRQYDISYRGDEIIVNVFKPGAFFPIGMALTKLPNRYFFDTDTAIEARMAPADEVVTFLKENPEVVLDLLTRVYSGLDGVLGRVVHLMAGSARSRLLYELIIECRRFGERSGYSCSLTINEVGLAARAGLSRETISREMQKLSKDNLLRIDHGHIHIPDYRKLEAKLGHSL